MTDDQRDEIRSVLEDIRAEEDEQRAERGYASNRLLRASVRLEQLLERSDAEVTGLSDDGRVMVGQPSRGRVRTDAEA